MANSCDFCQAPALSARFRLMEAHYHEDMAELYQRVKALETARPFSEARPSPATPPAIRYPRQKPAHHLACRTCRHFRVEAEYFYCTEQREEFPGLCERYRGEHDPD